MSNRSDVRDLLRQAAADGCTIKLRSNGHLTVTTPKGPVFCSQTPSCHRAVHKIRRDLRRNGVNV